MERIACLSIAALFMAANAFAIPPRFHLHHPQPSTEIISPQPDIPAIPDEYRDNKPQPLMRGDGFNYNLYYNYRLTPHLILQPNLQSTTKPGAVSDNSHLFVGGLSAGINF
ncbi:carbohydrate porin [Erwinia sp. AnSW2-5]|uniref:carbohydrate porin n=1 Tax=Erwinia sp. AnSW2-5 TaxID=3367692 RepID=UPI00385DFC7D